MNSGNAPGYKYDWAVLQVPRAFGTLLRIRGLDNVRLVLSPRAECLTSVSNRSFEWLPAMEAAIQVTRKPRPLPRTRAKSNKVKKRAQKKEIMNSSTFVPTANSFRALNTWFMLFETHTHTHICSFHPCKPRHTSCILASRKAHSVYLYGSWYIIFMRPGLCVKPYIERNAKNPTENYV